MLAVAVLPYGVVNASLVPWPAGAGLSVSCSNKTRRMLALSLGTKKSWQVPHRSDQASWVCVTLSLLSGTPSSQEWQRHVCGDEKHLDQARGVSAFRARPGSSLRWGIVLGSR